MMLTNFLVCIALLSLIHIATCGTINNKLENQVSLPADANPPYMARYVVHKSDWVSIGTISLLRLIKGFPFVGLKSIADGPTTNSTGIPYIFTTDLDTSMRDLKADNRCTMFMSLAQGDYCRKNNIDPMEHRCPRVMLTGSIERVQQNTTEYEFAKNALFSRHPSMVSWPIDHGFYIAKLNIIQIAIFYTYGPLQYVTPEEYFAVRLNTQDLQ